MSTTSSLKSFLIALYRSWILRILVLLVVLICAAYYIFVLPWLNRAISQNYFQQTGHQLQHDQIDIQLFKCNINLGHLKDSANLWQIANVNLNLDCWRSIRKRGLFVNEITIRQLQANPKQLEDGSWNFDDVIKHATAANKSTSNKKAASNPTPVVIKKITIANSTINSNVLALNNLPLAITPVDITLTNINLDGKTPTNLSIKANINQSTPLLVTGKLNLMTVQGELDVDVSGVPFVWFNELLKPYVAMEVLHGLIETRSHVVIDSGELSSIKSDGKLIELKVRPTTMEQDAVKWKSFEWSNVEAIVKDKSVHIPLLTLNEFDGQLIIDKNRVTNIQAMIIKPVPQAPANSAPANSAPANNLKPVQGSAVSSPNTQVSPDQIPPSQTWKFTVDKLAINNAALGFFDESLKPSFSVIVQKFTGDITDISNDAQHIAVINLAGNVDGYAPVTLNGKANFFIEQPQLEALFSFKKMDMGAFSPYSAEYAGWRIKKGLLSVDLNYHYDHGRIVGKNHVVMDHLEFGEKVRSTHIIDIPLRLGLSLLTDENGIAILDADISGDPKDPSFNIRDIIWRALRNTVKKIITSPFRLLGNLVNTKEDLGRIQFTPGESQLTEQATNKLKLLQEAIAKRPKMRLTIHGLYDENADVVALKHEQVKSALQKQGLTKDSIAIHDNAWAQGVNALYKTQGLTNASASVDDKYQELAEHEIVIAERLSNLARERAQAVKQYFVLQLGVSSEVLLLDSEDRCDNNNKCASSEVVFTLEE